jgi:hypothetical protein
VEKKGEISLVFCSISGGSSRKKVIEECFKLQNAPFCRLPLSSRILWPSILLLVPDWALWHLLHSPGFQLLVLVVSVCFAMVLCVLLLGGFGFVLAVLHLLSLCLDVLLLFLWS